MSCSLTVFSNKRVYPAIDFSLLSSNKTRRSLLDRKMLERMVDRNHLADMNPMEAMEFLLDRLRGTKSNEESFLNS